MCPIMFADINAGMRLAEEKKQLEAKCRQLGKAESLGRMAGAIADIALTRISRSSGQKKHFQHQETYTQKNAENPAVMWCRGD